MWVQMAEQTCSFPAGSLYTAALCSPYIAGVDTHVSAAPQAAADDTNQQTFATSMRKSAQIDMLPADGMNTRHRMNPL